MDSSGLLALSPELARLFSLAKYRAGAFGSNCGNRALVGRVQ